MEKGVIADLGRRDLKTPQTQKELVQNFVLVGFDVQHNLWFWLAAAVKTCVQMLLWVETLYPASHPIWNPKVCCR